MTLTLRPTHSSDLAFVAASEQSPENRSYVTPYSIAQHDTLLRDRQCRHLICQDSGPARPVGFVLLAGLGAPDRTIEFRRLVITEKGRGHGRAAVRLVKELAFRSLAAHRLWLDVVESNTRARTLYASEGFSEEGVLREAHWSGDAFVSLIVMSILEREFFEHA